MVLYSPSSSSLRSYKEAVGDSGFGAEEDEAMLGSKE